jgi:hypothetical protein
MSEFEFLSDDQGFENDLPAEDEDFPVTEGSEDEPDPAFDVMAFRERWKAAPHDRPALYTAEIGDDEGRQAQAASVGIPTPITVDVAEGFSPVTEGDPSYRHAIQKAEAIVRAGRAQIRSGSLPMDEASAELFESFVSEADLVPGPRHSELIQLAAHLVEQAEQTLADAEPWPAGGRVIERRFENLGDGRVRFSEKDVRGRVQTSEGTAQDLSELHPELVRSAPIDPELVAFDDVTSLDDMRGWSTERTLQLKAARPDIFEQLKRAQSDEMDGVRRSP